MPWCDAQLSYQLRYQLRYRINAAGQESVPLPYLLPIGKTRFKLLAVACLWQYSGGNVAASGFEQIPQEERTGWTRIPATQPILVAAADSLSDRMGRPLPVAGTYTVLRTRSTSYDANIALPDGPETIALRVLPEVEAQPARYRIKLSTIADNDALHEVAALTGLTVDADGFVPVYLNSSRLPRGRCQLSLSGDAGTSAANDASLFLIRVMPSAAPASRD